MCSNLSKQIIAATLLLVSQFSFAQEEKWTLATPLKEFTAGLDKGAEELKISTVLTKFKVSGKIPKRAQLFAVMSAMPEYTIIDPTKPLAEDNITVNNPEKCLKEVEFFGIKQVTLALAGLTASASEKQGHYEMEVPLKVMHEGCEKNVFKIEFYLKYNFNKKETAEMIQRFESISKTAYVDLYPLRYSGLDPASDGGGFISLELLPPKDQISEYTSELLEYDKVIDAKMYEPQGRQSLYWFNPKFTDAPRQFVIRRSFEVDAMVNRNLELNITKLPAPEKK